MKTAVVLAAVLLALAFLSTASASALTVYTAIGCNGNSNTYLGCGGCSNLTMFGGYDFVYTGQPLEIYDSYNCQSQYGPSVVTESFRSCGPVKFDRSIRIRCAEADNCLRSRADA